MEKIIDLFIFDTWIYIVSISLQVSGAVCLIINYWGNTKKNVILTYYVVGEIPKAQDNNMLLLKKQRLQKCAKDIYINRFAFICIVIGYGLGIIGKITDDSNKVFVYLFVVLFCGIFICLGCGVSSLLSKIIYSKDMEINKEILEEVVDVQWSDKEEADFVYNLFDKEEND